MKKFTSVFIAFLFILSVDVSAQSNWSVSPNPYLNSPEATTETVSQMKEFSIKQLQGIIDNECNEFSNFINLSIDNWVLARMGEKSESEAANYSWQLNMQMHASQFKMFAFPFGVSTYSAFNESIKKRFYVDKKGTKTSQQRFVKKITNYCRAHMGPEKYYSILSNPKYIRGKDKPFDLNSFEESRISNKSKTFINLNESTPLGSWKTPANLEKKIGFSDKLKGVAYTLISQDVEQSMLDQNQTWYVYQHVLNNKKSEFEKFLIKGGENKIFSLLVISVKNLDLKTNGFEDVDVYDTEEIRKLLDLPINFSPEYKRELMRHLGLLKTKKK